jgi:hypothetical protein
MSKDTRVIYAGGRSVAEPQGRASQMVVLPVQAAGSNPSSWKNVTWTTEGGVVHDLEVRARVTAVRATLGAFVKVLWYAELGVGDASFREPIAAPSPGAGTSIAPYWMGDRGMVLRVNARGVKLGFRCELVSGAATSLELLASIQPTATGPDTPQFPKCTAALAAERVAVPMSASEWRFRDPSTGAAFAAGSITGLSCCAGLVGPVLLANLADFTPISPFIQSYTCTVAHLVEFR